MNKTKTERKRSKRKQEPRWAPDRLIELRDRAGWTQTQMAKYLGYKHIQRVQELEHGARPVPEPQARLLDILDATLKQDEYIMPLGNGDFIYFMPVFRTQAQLEGKEQEPDGD